MAVGEDSRWDPPPPLPDTALSLLPRARALGRGRVADEEVEAELGGRFIPDDVRAYLRSAGTDRSALLWPVCSALACVTVGLVGALPFVARLTLAAGALGFVWIAARVLPAQRRLADQRVRFLKHGVVVVPDVRTTAEATRFSYEYSVDGTKHVHTMVKCDI